MSRITLALVLLLPAAAFAQKGPEGGYIFPSGGKAGTTIDVQLGGYNWTPDLEFFVSDPRVKLVTSGTLSPMFVPQPPYWFGAKGRLPSQPIPREFAAKLTIPAYVPPGPIYWQAASANGVTLPVAFMVSGDNEVIENEERTKPQDLGKAPVNVSGRLLRNEEVDRYTFIAPKDGLLTAELVSRRMGSKFLGLMQIRDPQGNLVADVAGGHHADPVATFTAKAGTEYHVSLHDVDFGGDRSYTYRLTVAYAPRIFAAIPPAGKRGDSAEVEFTGIGLATGTEKIEVVKRKVTFPKVGDSFAYRLETPAGVVAFPFILSDVPQTLAPKESIEAPPLALPVGITGALDQPDIEHHYTCVWKKGEVWFLTLEGQSIGSPLDVALTIIPPKGKEARSEDLPGTTDAGLDYVVPLDGKYEIIVSDTAGKSGSRLALYRLEISQGTPDFALRLTAPRVNVPLGGKFDLPVKAVRKGGFKGPITLSIKGLPAGIVPPTEAELTIGEGKTDIVVPLKAAEGAGTGAGLVTLEGSATLGTAPVTRRATATAAVHLITRDTDENQMPAFVVALTMKGKFKGRPVDQDTGRKVPRGATHPAEILIERLDGFDGEITLQMAAQQSYQNQGISGTDVVVPPGVGKALYPCYMPEWLETTRTSRMAIIAVSKVADPKGKVRYLTGDVAGFITMTMEGALLKVSNDTTAEQVIPKAKPFDVTLKIARVPQLVEPVVLELQTPKELAGKFKAETMTVKTGQDKVTVRVTPDAALTGLQTFSIRATALQAGKYKVVSEAKFVVEIMP